jgi:hypothetical protein
MEWAARLAARTGMRSIAIFSGLAVLAGPAAAGLAPLQTTGMWLKQAVQDGWFSLEAGLLLKLVQYGPTRRHVGRALPVSLLRDVE